MNAPRHPWPIILLHWLMAVLILGLFVIGWTMTELPKGAERSAAYGLHKSFGLLVLGLACLRLFARRRWQPLAVSGCDWRADLARVVHRLLYAFMLFAPLAGYLASSFTPYPLRFFGWEIPKAGWPDESWNGLFKYAHCLLVWAGAGIILLHVGGALAHLRRGEPVLRRMLPAVLFRK